jgi:hypothetical protein
LDFCHVLFLCWRQLCGSFPSFYKCSLSYWLNFPCRTNFPFLW